MRFCRYRLALVTHSRQAEWGDFQGQFEKSGTTSSWMLPLRIHSPRCEETRKGQQPQLRLQATVASEGRGGEGATGGPIAPGGAECSRALFTLQVQEQDKCSYCLKSLSFVMASHSSIDNQNNTGTTHKTQFLPSDRSPASCTETVRPTQHNHGLWVPIVQNPKPVYSSPASGDAGHDTCALRMAQGPGTSSPCPAACLTPLYSGHQRQVLCLKRTSGPGSSCPPTAHAPHEIPKLLTCCQRPW